VRVFSRAGHELRCLRLSPPEIKNNHENSMMKRALMVLTLGLLCGNLRAQAPLPPEIEDPQCLGISKEPAHATLMPYANLTEALAANRHASSFCRSLNGPWKFNWVPQPALRPVDFYKPDFDASGWTNIPVPSNWQIQGYDGAAVELHFPR
jgi:beta-galactosidase